MTGPLLAFYSPTFYTWGLKSIATVTPVFWLLLVMLKDFKTFFCFLVSSMLVSSSWISFVQQVGFEERWWNGVCVQSSRLIWVALRIQFILHLQLEKSSTGSGAMTRGCRMRSTYYLFSTSVWSVHRHVCFALSRPRAKCMELSLVDSRNTHCELSWK